MSYPQGDPNQPHDPNQAAQQPQPQPVYYPQAYPYPAYQPPQDHPKSTMAMVLGIVSLAACGLVGPFAWVIGKRTVREIDESGGTLGGRGQAQAGYIMGLIGTILLILSVVLIVLYIVFIVILVSSASTF